MAFCERFCRELADHGFFGPIRPHLIGSHFASRAEAQHRERACREALEPYIVRLSAKLTEHLGGKGLRAPSVRRGSKPTTEELLHSPIT